jgi:hypothetical protein
MWKLLLEIFILHLSQWVYRWIHLGGHLIEVLCFWKYCRMFSNIFRSLWVVKKKITDLEVDDSEFLIFEWIFLALVMLASFLYMMNKFRFTFLLLVNHILSCFGVNPLWLLSSLFSCLVGQGWSMWFDSQFIRTSVVFLEKFGLLLFGLSIQTHQNLIQRKLSLAISISKFKMKGKWWNFTSLAIDKLSPSSKLLVLSNPLNLICEIVEMKRLVEENHIKIWFQFHQ